MRNYDHKKIESKIQKEWEKKKSYKAKDGKGKKFYSLIEFPYPSGDGLHVGHPRPYIGMDIISRKKRMENFNVLFPIGWDAFGLPTENYAIKTGIHPKIVTKKNTDNFRRQIKMLGISFDWSREINTTDPAYYKWTQWIFLQMFKKGLAYKAEIPINWCPRCKIGLANEEVIDGKCERCGAQTERRMKKQWILAITKYAKRLDKDLDLVDYPERVKLSQRNWIGRSEGSEIEFKIISGGKRSDLKGAQGPTLKSFNVFTTRADTLLGVTYIVLAPEHELIEKLKSQITNWSEVEKYIQKVKKESELERTAENKEKTGIELKGIKAINPVNKEEVPVWVADYVLVNYGTGAVMAVPAHDERDFEFAKKYDLPVKQVIVPFIDIDSGEFAFRPESPIVKRNCILAIIKHWEKDEFLCLSSKKHGWKTFVIGGIEEGESAIEAAKREIIEETGFSDLKFIKKLGGEIIARHFAPHKNENRFASLQGFYFELQSDKFIPLTEYEKSHQEVLWVKKDNMAATLKPKITDWVFWQRLIFGSSDLFAEDGALINSEKFDGLASKEARKKITEFVGGKIVTKFKLHDWVFSRQRYWGEPIPIIECEKCGLIPMPEKELPLKLPEVKRYKLTETGESPLASIKKWVNTKCPKCKGKAKRETDTMPNWAGSSWYYLRFADPQNKKVFADKKLLKYWTPVDWYNGGMEHTTLHLLYSRFWHKFLYDSKLVPTKEPYLKRTSHGMILGEGGVKMSKSLGNVVNPDEIVKIYGADTLRVYEMFIGPFEDAAVWNTESIIGSRRFIEKVWRIGEKILEQKNSSGLTLPGVPGGTHTVQNSSVPKFLNKTIKKVGEDIEEMHFNTAISAMMILATEMEKEQGRTLNLQKGSTLNLEDYKKFLQILSPFAPHVTQEIWQLLGEKKSISFSKWPKYDEKLIKDDEIKIAVQVNGKVRTEIMIEVGEKEEEIKKKVMSNKAVLKFTAEVEPRKVIYVKNRLINIVV